MPDPAQVFPAITAENVRRVCAGASDADLDSDDFGNEFERCADNDGGHLYLNGYCVHCGSEGR